MDINSKTWRMVDGYPVHDGDCHIFTYHICTCGLLNHLLWKVELIPKEKYDDFCKELNKQEEAMLWLINKSEYKKL